jgi:tetratricopeptide (TPR) repeat protein
MHDPYFEATCADIRGFDLGDDGPLLAVLDVVGEPSADERLLRAVLRARAGRDDDAVDDLSVVADSGHARSLAWYLAAHCRARTEDLPAASGLLARARAAASEDGLVPAADVAHARGRIAWLSGDLPTAMAAVREGLEADDGDATRWLDLGVLAASADLYDEAATAFERALELEGDLAAAHYEAAVLLSRRSPHEGAAARWRQAFAIDPALRGRAMADERLRQARDVPALAAVLGAPPAPDLTWLDEAPTWLRAMTRDPALLERGIVWIGEHARRAHAAEVAAAYERGLAGTMFTEPTLAHARARLSSMVVVAQLPIRPTREGTPEMAELWLDEAAPDRLWLAWSAHMPPFLWVDVGTSVARVVAAWDPLTSGRPLRADLPSVHRVFLGYAGQLVVPDPATGELSPSGIPQLEQHLALSPYLESGAHGGAYADDPWPDVVPAQPGFAAKFEAHQAIVAAQSAAHVWSMTRRLRYSRGYLSIELHHDDVIVLELRYQPNPHPEVTDAMNDAFGSEYPADLPLDAIATVLGLVFDSAADLEPSLAELEADGDAEQLAGLLYVLSALRHGELDAHAIWRGFADHADVTVRTAVASIAVAYNYESLLEERALLERDPALRGEIEQALDDGLQPPQWDPYAPEDGEEDES